MFFSDGQERIENLIADFVKINAFKFDTLFYIGISSVEFDKFRC